MLVNGARMIVFSGNRPPLAAPITIRLTVTTGMVIAGVAVTIGAVRIGVAVVIKAALPTGGQVADKKALLAMIKPAKPVAEMTETELAKQIASVAEAAPKPTNE